MGRPEEDIYINYSAEWRGVSPTQWDRWKSDRLNWSDRLEQVFRRRNLTAYKAAKLSGISRGAISAWKRSDNVSINARTLILLAHGLGLAPWELLKEILDGVEGEKKKSSG